MQYNTDLARTILREFADQANASIPLRTDRMTLSPPGGLPLSDDVANHIDRLVSVGILQRTNEIPMKPPADPGTLRATDY